MEGLVPPSREGGEKICLEFDTPPFLHAGRLITAFLALLHPGGSNAVALLLRLVLLELELLIFGPERLPGCTLDICNCSTRVPFMGPWYSCAG